MIIIIIIIMIKNLVILSAVLDSAAVECIYNVASNFKMKATKLLLT